MKTLDRYCFKHRSWSSSPSPCACHSVADDWKAWDVGAEPKDPELAEELRSREREFLDNDKARVYDRKPEGET
jgi:hypothetical protein